MHLVWKTKHTVDASTPSPQQPKRIDLPSPPVRPIFNAPILDADMRIVDGVRTQDGGFILATTTGPVLVRGDYWHPLTGADGVPRVDMTCVLLGRDGAIWGGTEEGVWRHYNGRFNYFWGKRWLLDNKVTGLSETSDGKIIVHTAKGSSTLWQDHVALSVLADHFEKITLQRHDRNGYITGCGLKKQGDPKAGVIPEASDNDGLWTALAVAAYAFKAAATGNPQDKRLCVRYLDAILDLERLTGIPGFPARAIMTETERQAGVLGFSDTETVRLEGEETKIWFKSPVDPNIWCKGDTSSDELDGHYYAWFIADFVLNDPAIRKKMAPVVKRVTDHLISHNHRMFGHHGKRTLWGEWNPESINGSLQWYEERGLNSMEYITYLAIAHRITGDKKYLDVREEFIRKHHYDLNSLLYRDGSLWYQVNHSDDELAMTVWLPMILCETDPWRKQLWVRNLMTAWDGTKGSRGIKAERSPFYIAHIMALTGDTDAAGTMTDVLGHWPLDLVNHTIKNSHRHDIQLRTHQSRGTEQFLTNTLPLEEQRVMRWNGSPFEPDHGGDGQSEEDGIAFLLPYWMGVYYGFIHATD